MQNGIRSTQNQIEGRRRQKIKQKQKESKKQAVPRFKNK